jgi:hypothetical protein
LPKPTPPNISRGLLAGSLAQSEEAFFWRKAAFVGWWNLLPGFAISSASDRTQPEARDLQALTTMSTEFVTETTFLPQIKFGLTTHADVVQRGIDSSASPIASNGSIAVVLGHAGQLRKIR